jgi:hypothetical protein
MHGPLHVKNLLHISKTPVASSGKCITKDGHVYGQNIQEVCLVYNMFSYGYLHLLVLTTISNDKFVE